MIRLSEYIDEKLIVFLDTTSKEAVLKKLVDVVITEKELPAHDRFYQAILDREGLVSTAIGMGVAIPHAKLPVYTDFFMAVGVLQKGIDWSAPDDSLVRLVFLIGGPDNKQTEYLKLLSSITTVMRNEQLRRRLTTATSPEAVAALLRSAVVS
jgi:nitrogen PTS system EIIA component